MAPSRGSPARALWVAPSWGCPAAAPPLLFFCLWAWQAAASWKLAAVLTRVSLSCNARLINACTGDATWRVSLRPQRRRCRARRPSQCLCHAVPAGPSLAGQQDRRLNLQGSRDLHTRWLDATSLTAPVQNSSASAGTSSREWSACWGASRSDACSSSSWHMHKQQPCK